MPYKTSDFFKEMSEETVYRTTKKDADINYISIYNGFSLTNMSEMSNPF